MLTEPVKQFLEALRSGKYKQIQGVLKNGEGYCCLGVAAELFLPEGGKIEEKDEIFQFSGSSGNEAATAHLPQYAIDALGTYSWSGAPRGTTLTTPSMMRMNDKFGWSFTQIADFLEANAKFYFKGCTEEKPE